MTQASSQPSDKGGLSLLLFHCVFTEATVTHFMHEFDLDLYRQLPHLYVVCLAETSRNIKTVRAGFVIKTSYTHNDNDFLQTLTNVVSMEPRLECLITDRSSFLPARLSFLDDEPITEEEMLRITVQQSFKHGTGGNA